MQFNLRTIFTIVTLAGIFAGIGAKLSQSSIPWRDMERDDFFGRDNHNRPIVMIFGVQEPDDAPSTVETMEIDWNVQSLVRNSQLARYFHVRGIKPILASSEIELFIIASEERKLALNVKTTPAPFFAVRKPDGGWLLYSIYSSSGAITTSEQVIAFLDSELEGS